MKWALAVALASLRGYQRFVSPLLPRSCRFEPSCSRYSYEALQRYGLVKGSLMTMKRLFRCHPFHPGGFDPVK
jgi:hypothetical protein